MIVKENVIFDIGSYPLSVSDYTFEKFTKIRYNLLCNEYIINPYLTEDELDDERIHTQPTR